MNALLWVLPISLAALSFGSCKTISQSQRGTEGGSGLSSVTIKSPKREDVPTDDAFRNLKSMAVLVNTYNWLDSVRYQECADRTEEINTSISDGSKSSDFKVYQRCAHTIETAIYSSFSDTLPVLYGSAYVTPDQLKNLKTLDVRIKLEVTAFGIKNGYIKSIDLPVIAAPTPATTDVSVSVDSSAPLKTTDVSKYTKVGSINLSEIVDAKDASLKRLYAGFQLDKTDERIFPYKFFCRLKIAFQSSQDPVFNEGLFFGGLEIGSTISTIKFDREISNQKIKDVGLKNLRAVGTLEFCYTIDDVSALVK